MSGEYFDMHRDLTPTDLSLLKIEVLDKPPEAALPVNLPDYWLDRIGRDYQMLEGETEADGDHSYLSGPLALVLRLLEEKAGSSSLNLPVEEVERCVAMYKVEIAAEEVSRRTDVKLEPATIETIFTNRNLQKRR